MVIDKRDGTILDEGRRLHRVAEAAQFLAISRSKLYAMMDAGELAYVKIGRSRRVSTAAILAVIESSRIGR